MIDAGSCGATGQGDSAVSRKHTLVILNPGHFHAALSLRERHALIDDDIHVFAEDGPDVDHFVNLVHAFNDRPHDPTRWTLYVYRGADFLEKLLAQRPGELVIVAGRNNEKLPFIQLLHAQGFHVLGDKPWLIASQQLDLLRQATGGAPLAMDIMTERHEIANRLQRALARRPEVFGDYVAHGDLPAISLRSVHHLYKIVNQQPLLRPAWYFDPTEQGEGITDVTTHLVDLVQWMTGTDQAFDFARDIEGLRARQWPTVVPSDAFTRITGLARFPRFLQERLVDGALPLQCNAALTYRLRGVAVEVETLWELEEPRGGSDLHYATLRGSRCELAVEQGPHTRFQSTLSVRPEVDGPQFAAALTQAVADLQGDFPGLDFAPEAEGYRMNIPQALRTTHEQRFAAVLHTFVNYLDQGAWPARIGADLEMKYTLLAHALDLAHGAAPDGSGIEQSKI